MQSWYPNNTDNVTLTCGLTKYNRGLALSFSVSSCIRRTSSRRAEPSADTSSRDIPPSARGSAPTSGNDFLRCRVCGVLNICHTIRTFKYCSGERRYLNFRTRNQPANCTSKTCIFAVCSYLKLSCQFNPTTIKLESLLLSVILKIFIRYRSRLKFNIIEVSIIHTELSISRST